MISWTYKLWRTAGIATVVGLAACGGEGGENAGESGEAAQHGEAGEALPPAPVSASSGEAGEAGAAQAYAGLAGDQLSALRLQQLRGFVLAATLLVDDATGEASSEAASLLISQGLLEVYDPAADQFAGLDVSPLRQAANDPTATRARMLQYLQAGERAIDAAMSGLEVNGPDLVIRMLDISTGLYQQVNGPDGVDAIEYEHSHGAAIAARHALVIYEDQIRGANLLAYSRSLRELNTYLDLWPTPIAPEQPTSYQDVIAQSSRIKLAMSPFL